MCSCLFISANSVIYGSDLVEEFKTKLLEQYYAIIKDLGPKEQKALKAEYTY